MGDNPAPKKRGGRRRKLTDPDVRATLLQVIRAGGSKHDAAAKACVTYQTLLNEEGRDAGFATALKQAETDGKLLLIARVFKASKDDWRSAAWMLERKWSDDYARRDPGSISFAQFSGAVFSILSAMVRVIPAEHHAALKIEAEKIIEETILNANRKR